MFFSVKILIHPSLQRHSQMLHFLFQAFLASLARFRHPEFFAKTLFLHRPLWILTRLCFHLYPRLWRATGRLAGHESGSYILIPNVSQTSMCYGLRPNWIKLSCWGHALEGNVGTSVASCLYLGPYEVSWPSLPHAPPLPWITLCLSHQGSLSHDWKCEANNTFLQ